MLRRITTLSFLALVALLATLAAQDNFTISSAETLEWNSSVPATLATLTYGGILTIDGPPREGLRRVELGAGWWCGPKSTGGFTCGEEPTSITFRGGAGLQSTTPLLEWSDNPQPRANFFSQERASACAGVVASTGLRCFDVATPAPPVTITVGPTTLAAPGLKVYTTFLGLPCGDAFPMPGCLPPAMQGWLVQIEGGSDYQYLDVTLVYTDADGSRHLHTQECIPRAESFQGKPPFTAVPFAVGRAKSPPWFPTGTTVVRTEVWPSRPGCHEPPQ